ncbi:ribonuclease domain-containing protein [Paenarthrobacter sp. NPDC089322]|uniref:ribonuclease domain-containing protein n=1 Tax=Paenarthrobacter sp. NPDC089322 TaxID=3155065 RepID=UPI00342934AF
MSRNRWVAFAGLVIAVVVLVAAMVGGGTLAGPNSAPTTAPPSGSLSITTAAPTSFVAAPGNPSDLPEVNASQLPKEARQTLALIAKGGPYPYDRDGANFGNFEGLLPKKSSGFYKEYTVKTPGESDRGARRIVAGKDGAKYYTVDHYDSFKFIVEGK